MGALRKAGVWLGLVEDDDDRVRQRDYDERLVPDSGSASRYTDEFADDDDRRRTCQRCRVPERCPDRSARSVLPNSEDDRSTTAASAASERSSVR